MEADIRISPFRYTQMIVFWLNAVMTLATCFEYVAISEATSVYYNISVPEVLWTTNVYAVTNAVFMLFGSWVIEKYGIRISLLACSLLNCLGNGLKCGSVDRKRFYLVVIGQAIASISHVFILLLPSRLAGIWFGARSVSTATAVAVSSLAVGRGLGLFIPRYGITETNSSLDDIGDEMQTLQNSYFGSSTLVFLITVLASKDKPSFSPSKASSLRNGSAEMNVKYCTTIKSFVKNSNASLYFVGFGINVAVSYWYSRIFKSLGAVSFKDNKNNLDWIEFYLNMAGAPLAIFCGIWMDRTRHYKAAAIITYSSLLVSIVLFGVILHLTPGVLWLFIPASLTGIYPYLAVAYEFATEISYPENEHVVAGLNFTAAWLVVLIINPVLMYVEYFVTRYSDVILLSSLAGLLSIGLIITAFVKPSYSRQAAEDRTFSSSPNIQEYTRF